MAARWQKNQATASLRRCLMKIRHKDDGTRAPRETDFTGYVFISRDATQQALGTGAIANNRRALVVADDTVESVDTGADTLTLTGHGYETGDGPFTADEALGSIAIGDDVYIISVDANTIQVATSADDAYAGTYEALTGTEAGAIISDNADTQRGIDGEWWYTATQAETNYDASEIWVTLAHATYEGEVSVDVMTEAASVWAETADGFTMKQLVVGTARQALATRVISGTTQTTRDLADTKDSHHGTVTASGRVATIDDLD